MDKIHITIIYLLNRLQAQLLFGLYADAHKTLKLLEELVERAALDGDTPPPILEDEPLLAIV